MITAMRCGSWARILFWRSLPRLPTYSFALALRNTHGCASFLFLPMEASITPV